MYWKPAASSALPSLPILICASVVGTRLMQAAIFMGCSRAPGAVELRGSAAKRGEETIRALRKGQGERERVTDRARRRMIAVVPELGDRHGLAPPGLRPRVERSDRRRSADGEGAARV